MSPRQDSWSDPRANPQTGPPTSGRRGCAFEDRGTSCPVGWSSAACPERHGRFPQAHRNRRLARLEERTSAAARPIRRQLVRLRRTGDTLGRVDEESLHADQLFCDHPLERPELVGVDDDPPFARQAEIDHPTEIHAIGRGPADDVTEIERVQPARFAPPPDVAPRS
jgi:hypothetical protein